MYLLLLYCVRVTFTVAILILVFLIRSKLTGICSVALCCLIFFVKMFKILAAACDFSCCFSIYTKNICALFGAVD